MVKTTTSQKDLIQTMTKEGKSVQEIANSLNINYGTVYYYASKVAAEVSAKSPQHKAWETRRAKDNLDYYLTLSAGKKAAFTKRLNKGLDPKTPIAKAKVAKVKQARPKKVAVLEAFTFNGTVKIDKELLKYLHRHPNGKEVMFVKTKLG